MTLLLNGKTNDIIDAYWNKNAAATVPAYNQFLPIAQFAAVNRAISTEDSVLYNLSFYAYVEPGGILTGYVFQHAGSEDGVSTNIPTLSYIRQRYSTPVLGKSGGGDVSFGFFSNVPSDFSTVFIDTINVIKSENSVMPIVNNTDGPIEFQPKSLTSLTTRGK